MESNYPKVPQIQCYHEQIQENREHRGGDFMPIGAPAETLCDLCEAWQLFFTKQYADLLAV
jgi:hypothetical protein